MQCSLVICVNYRATRSTTEAREAEKCLFVPADEVEEEVYKLRALKYVSINNTTVTV